MTSTCIVNPSVSIRREVPVTCKKRGKPISESFLIIVADFTHVDLGTKLTNIFYLMDQIVKMVDRGLVKREIKETCKIQCKFSSYCGICLSLLEFFVDDDRISETHSYLEKLDRLKKHCRIILRIYRACCTVKVANMYVRSYYQ